MNLATGSRKTHTLTFLALVALLAAGTVPQAFAAESTVEQVGSAVVKYEGSNIQAAVGYRFADDTLGSKWLFLDFAATGTEGESVAIARTKISVQTPDGNTVPLATQKEFLDAYNQLRSEIARANIAGEPLDYWGGRRPCLLDFFSSGTHVVQESAFVNVYRVCFGRLYFHVPGGVQPGKYVLVVGLKEGEMRIPFTLQ
jgi:hypothetical protein